MKSDTLLAEDVRMEPARDPIRVHATTTASAQQVGGGQGTLGILRYAYVTLCLDDMLWNMHPPRISRYSSHTV